MGRLLERPQPPLLPAGLLRAGAALPGLLAMEFDATGDRRSARVAFGVAARAADASGDRNLAVWVRAQEADGLLWAGMPHSLVTALPDKARALPVTRELRALTVGVWAPGTPPSRAGWAVDEAGERCRGPAKFPGGVR